MHTKDGQCTAEPFLPCTFFVTQSLETCNNLSAEKKIKLLSLNRGYNNILSGFLHYFIKNPQKIPFFYSSFKDITLFN
jgi:hypothetical protein